MDGITFSNFLNSISHKPIKVIDDIILLKDYVSIDLSTENKDLATINVSFSKDWEVYIENYLEKNNAKVAYGGYLEKRAIYDRSPYFINESTENERNIHLGIDLWCEEQTKVLAVLGGEIHSFQNNTNFGDYGPTIILKHIVNGVEFYSLYGHLSLPSIEHLKVGATIHQGQCIGYFGDASVNGDYAPHLHFQLIRDLQSNFGDYPGVSSKWSLDFYSKNCPDPNLLLKLH